MELSAGERYTTVYYVKVDIPTTGSGGMENGSAWRQTLLPKAYKEI
jgi:hypothetical protein